VEDQEKALRFYTDVFGFMKKADITQRPYRWLTVVSPEEPRSVACFIPSMVTCAVSTDWATKSAAISE
jgi:catechol 2,3-dioxygenase-like lactoylglutathione lyase family enzyme